jgi:hypothetical protein
LQGTPCTATQTLGLRSRIPASQCVFFQAFSRSSSCYMTRFTSMQGTFLEFHLGTTGTDHAKERKGTQVEWVPQCVVGCTSWKAHKGTQSARTAQARMAPMGTTSEHPCWKNHTRVRDRCMVY